MSVDEQVRANHERLKAIRERDDIKIRRSKYLRETIRKSDGTEIPFNLRYYQVQMVLHLLAMNSFIVGDDTGLGKTAESIAASTYLFEKDPDLKVIVLTKKSAVPQWVKEWARFTVGVKVLTLKGGPKRRAKIYAEWVESTGPTVMVGGYDAVKRDIALVQEWKDYLLILDEATVFKNPSTQVHQVCKHMARQACRTWGLTATLIKNNLVEGYGIMQVVVPGLFRHSKNAFIKDYCITRLQPIKGGRQVPVIVGYRDRDIERFKEKIDPFYLGRPKHQVASELPVLQIKDVNVGLTRFQKQKYKEALDGLLELGTGEEKETDKLTAIIYCQQIVNHPALLEFDDEKSEKLATLVDMLTEGGDLEGEKVIVFTRFKRMVDYAVPYLKKKGVKAVRVTGSESEDERAAAQDAFQDPSSDVAVIFITMAGGDAINLQAAKAIVFYDTPWSAGDYLQCLDSETEILTPQGFASRGDIVEGDLVAAFCPDTSKITWEPVLSTVDRPLQPDEQMYQVKSRHLDIRVTGGHRMLFRRKTVRDKRAVWPGAWSFQTAEEMSLQRSHYQIPAVGYAGGFSGVPLTDAQLELLGWFTSDGHLNTTTHQLVISQANHQPQIEDLRRCLNSCGLDWSEYHRDPTTGFPNGKPQTVFSIPKGTQGGSRARNGWVELEPYLDKDFSPLLNDMTEQQLERFLWGLHLGDGSKYRGSDWTQRSYHIYTSRRVFADRLQQACVVRGYRCNISIRAAVPGRKEGYILHIKKASAWSLCGNAGSGERSHMMLSEAKPGERVWCVENPLGTLVTRRGGKVAVMGNCLGRMIRIGSEHDRVYALHLIAAETIDERVQGVLRKKMNLVEAILGQRLKGETGDGEDGEEVVFEESSEINDLFDALVNDARKKA